MQIWVDSANDGKKNLNENSPLSVVDSSWTLYFHTILPIYGAAAAQYNPFLFTADYYYFHWQHFFSFLFFQYAINRQILILIYRFLYLMPPKKKNTLRSQPNISLITFFFMSRCARNEKGHSPKSPGSCTHKHARTPLTMHTTILNYTCVYMYL